MSIDILNKDQQHVYEWLKTINTVARWDNKAKGLAALRAVLRELRDNLQIEVLAHFTAELPIFIRGLLFENWRPTDAPLKERHREDFLASVYQILAHMGYEEIDPERAAKAVFSAIEQHISRGEVDKLTRVLPRGIWEIWSQ